MPTQKGGNIQTKQKKTTPPNPTQTKNTLPPLRALFAEKKHLLSLYNAVNGTDYTNEDDLEVNTLDNVIYMKMKNDISFLFGFSLNLYEHQSSMNPNMPPADLFYVADLLQKIVKDKNLYSSSRVGIPTPRFVMFYNGTDEEAGAVGVETVGLLPSAGRRSGTGTESQGL